ncbi:hypothetical protein OESDEN_03022 [Oesophagostomum dentatum]|uniref:beta-N-acetylhexosaminidase n=1 Tax=Oesophagostomum dentatum TaxID=61180 RepID=A0A0B1TME6_OESDE|nr:hypothetical protein OESDEN_03022 [Oesophagostomum dentatum]
MFPYSGNLTQVRRSDSYDVSDIAKINELAARNRLEIIPLVQTFGHMEFVLKHSAFFELRENVIATIVHLDLKGAPPILKVYEWLFPLLKKMNVDGVLMEYEDMFPYSGNLTQVRRSDSYDVSDIAKINEVQALHPHSKRIHIGADEALHIAEDYRCKARLSAIGETDPNRAKEKLKLNHIANVARLAKSAGFEEVFAWNDMFDKSYVEDMHQFELGKLIIPVVWGYRTDVTAEGYFPDGLFDRIAQVFRKIYFASAFKGAQWQGENYIDVERYLQTHQSYVELYRKFSKLKEELSKYYLPNDVNEFLNTKVFSLRLALS